MSTAGPIAHLRQAFAAPVVARSVFVAVIVGSILNVINQGDIMLVGGSMNYWKLALTYVVPFCVSTYGAYSAIAVMRSRADNTMVPHSVSSRNIGAKKNEHNV